MRSPDRPLHLAFLGCGDITRRHRRTIGALDGAVQCSFASRDAGRAADYARRLAGAAHWGSYEAALGDPRVDVVLVATPTASHRDLTQRALHAGKHVIVEKPAFLRSCDVESVEALAAAAGRTVLVAENYAYKPLAATLRALVTSGSLGEILFVQLNALKRQVNDDWRDVPQLAGGGALFEGGVHWLDLIAHLGLKVESVQGHRPGDLERLERSMLVTVQYEQGAVGTLAHSWETPGLLRGLQLSRIAGTRGSVTFESNGLFVHARDGGGSRWIMPGLRDIGGYRAMFADFFRTLRTGAEPRMTLARARFDLELVEAAYRSLP